MKLILQALADKGLTQEQLPAETQEEIKRHKEMIVKYNAACDEYEEDEEQDAEIEQQLDEQEDYLATNEARIVESINAFNPAPAPARTPDPEPPAPAPTPDPEPPAKEKKGGAGWLIFGAAVMLITVGAVNVFKKRA